MLLPPTISHGRVQIKEFVEFTILFIISWNFFKLLYRLHSPRVKRNLISSIRSFICELPQELPNELSLMILRKKEILGKFQYSILHGEKPSVQYPLQKYIFITGAQKTGKNRYQDFLVFSTAHK